jgi:hypothetical protein
VSEAAAVAVRSVTESVPMVAGKVGLGGAGTGTRPVGLASGGTEVSPLASGRGGVVDVSPSLASGAEPASGSGTSSVEPHAEAAVPSVETSVTRARRGRREARMRPLSMQTFCQSTKRERAATSRGEACRVRPCGRGRCGRQAPPGLSYRIRFIRSDTPGLVEEPVFVRVFAAPVLAPGLQSLVVAARGTSARLPNPASVLS